MSPSEDSTALDRFGDLSMKNDDPLDEPIAQIEVTDSKHHHSETIVLFPRDELWVGRALPRRQDGHNLSYSIPDIHVSKLHFRIYSVIYDNEKEKSDVDPLIYCEDMDSSNGTYVNRHIIGMQGRESPGWLLKDGDEINIRPYWRFRFSQLTTAETPDAVALEKDKDDMLNFQDEFVVSPRILGSGFSATVYLAEEVEKKKQVACKIVRSFKWDFDINDEQQRSASQAVIDERRKVMREVKILAQLSHPHVINLIKTFYSQTKMFIFMELASAGDLYSFLRSHGDYLDDEHGRVIALQVVLAIEYIHSKGIAHRDIKPENILVINREFGGRVVLTDFGFARYQGEGKNTSGRMKSMVGTPGYYAPEVESPDDHKRGYTLAVDLWSLGVLTACILTGYQEPPEQPLCQLSQMDIYTQIDNDMNTDVELSSTAKKFLRALLVIIPEQRITAAYARSHSWFKKPRSEAAIIEQRYDQIIRFWKKRENSDIMEKLPDPEPEPRLLAGCGPKSRRKLPDTTAIPYIGLDRHIQQPRDMGSRAAVLNKLQDIGAHFLPAELETQSKFFPQNKTPAIIRSGGDLFGMQPGGFGQISVQKELRESICAKAPPRCISDSFSRQEESDRDAFQSSQSYGGFSQNSSMEEVTSMVEDTSMDDATCVEDTNMGEDTSMEGSIDTTDSIADLSEEMEE